jgi:hypothetical protein
MEKKHQFKSDICGLVLSEKINSPNLEEGEGRFKKKKTRRLTGL